MKYDDAIKLQKEIAKKVVTEDDFGQINLICGVDVAYSGDIAYCSAVVTDSDLHLVNPSTCKRRQRTHMCPDF